MAIVQFINAEYIKNYTPIGKLVSIEQIKPTNIEVQDSWIQDQLGSNFYVYLQTQYQSQTLNANEQILLTKIEPAQAYRVAEQMLPFVNWQINNKGVMTQSGDFAASSDLTNMKYLRNELRNRAEFYAKRLSVYLCDNADLFPEYTVDNSTDMKPSPSGYDDCGLFLYD